MSSRQPRERDRVRETKAGGEAPAAADPAPSIDPLLSRGPGCSPVWVIRAWGGGDSPHEVPDRNPTCHLHLGGCQGRSTPSCSQGLGRGGRCLCGAGCPTAAGTLRELPAGMSRDAGLSQLLPTAWAAPAWQPEPGIGKSMK